MSEPKIRLSQVSPSASGNDRITGNVTITGSVNVSTANITTIVTGNALTLSTGTGSNGNIIFSANGTEDMRILANGFVSIGTTSPTTRLTIGDGSHGIGFSYLESASLPSIAGLFTDISTGQTGYGSLLIKARTDFGGFYSINFFTSASNNTPAERMRITSGGNVGIGTTSPDTRLHIYHAGQPPISDSLFASMILDTDSTANYQRIRFDVGATPYWGIMREATTNNFAISGRINGSWADHVLTITPAAGNVGIGTSNPSVRLHIHGGTGEGSITMGGRSDWTSGSGEYAVGRITGRNIGAGVDTTQIKLDGDNLTGSIGFWTASAGTLGQRMAILGSGNVGIGTHNPTTRLHVNGGALIQGNLSLNNNVFSNFELLGYENNFIRPPSGGYGGFRFRTFDGSEAGYLLLRDTTDVDVYREYGITLVMDRGPITLAARGGVIGNNSVRNFIHFMTANGGDAVTRMTISKDGYVTQPFQPTFHAHGVTGGTFASGSAWIFPTAPVNIGSHYNTGNGRFTAPVSGTYLFYWGNIGTPGNDVMRYYFERNGTGVNSSYHLRLDTTATGTEYASSATQTIIISLTAGDYVRIYFAADGGTSSYPSGNDATNPYPVFGGYLLG